MMPLCTELIQEGWKAILEACHSAFLLPISYSMLRRGLLDYYQIFMQPCSQPSVKTALEQGNSKVFHNLPRGVGSCIQK